MKFICTQENFNQGLNLVNHLTNKNTALPILNNILIEAKEGSVVLTTTNLEMAITTVIRGRVEQEGAFTVQGRIISEYSRLLPKENIEISLKDNSLQVVCDSQQTTINGLSAEDFPVIPKINEENKYQVKPQDLKTALNQTLFAVSLDESRAELGGVLFWFGQKNLTLAGTDSFRLAEKKTPLIKGGQEAKVIVPLKTCQEASRILNDLNEVEKVEIIISDNQVVFVFGETRLMSRLIEGQYPDYTQIIPKDFKTTTTVATNELARTIKSAALFCKPGINDVRVVVVGQKKELVVAAANSGVGESTIKLSAEIKGEDNEAVFNYRYLLDGLNNLNSQQTVLQLINSQQSAILKPQQDDSYLYIVMPIRQ